MINLPKIPKGCCKDLSTSTRTVERSEKEDRRKVHWTDDTGRSFESVKLPCRSCPSIFPRSGLPITLHRRIRFCYALSRIESISEINFDAIAEEQTRDEELQQLLHSNALKFKPSTLSSGKKLWCDISTQKSGLTSHRNLGFKCSNFMA
ncbi:retrovirus-related Pol polyprotein from transposon opus [Trichonephila clavipes]|nr:retrovirus-related Pol polyprotein from transposon opus [Trichonephila clavipes]